MSSMEEARRLAGGFGGEKCNSINCTASENRQNSRGEGTFSSRRSSRRCSTLLTPRCCSRKAINSSVRWPQTPLGWNPGRYGAGRDDVACDALRRWLGSGEDDEGSGAGEG